MKLHQRTRVVVDQARLEFDRFQLGNERWCRAGQRRFNVEFQVNPEVVDFLRDNPDKSSTALAELWISRVITKRTP